MKWTSEIFILCTIYCPVNLFCSSKDILMRVMAQNLSPDVTLVEKVVMILFSEVTILESGLF